MIACEIETQRIWESFTTRQWNGAKSSIPSNTLEGRKMGKRESKIFSKKCRSMPAHFLCPISLEPMKDPVTICTGQTYDRFSIEKWISKGHKTCPITRLHLEDLTLIPNLIVKQLIEAWWAENSGKVEESQDVFLKSNSLPKQVADREHILGLLNQIARGDNVRCAVQRLRILAKEEHNKMFIVETGGILMLASLLQVDLNVLEDSEEFETREETLGLLTLLCRGSAEARTVVFEPHVIDYVAWHLQHGSIVIKLNSAALLKSFMRDQDLCPLVVKMPEIWQGLLALLKEHLSPRATKAVLKILHVACLPSGNRTKAVEMGVVDVLVEFIVELKTVATYEICLAILELLCITNEGQDAVCRNGLAVPAIVKLVVGSSRKCTEHAVSCLLLVCQSGPVEVLQVALYSGAQRQLLLLLQSDSTDCAKRKALELLKLFHAVLDGSKEGTHLDFKNVESY